MAKNLRFNKPIKKLNKRGLSTIIITVILIALSLAAVVLVWGFVNSLIKKQIGSTESCFGNYDKVQINKQYTCYEDLGTGAYALRFSLAVGSVNLTKVVVSVSSASAVQSYEITNEEQAIPNMENYPSLTTGIILPSKNSGLTYRVTVPSTVDSIQVAPVINEEQCEISDSILNIKKCENKISRLPLSCLDILNSGNSVGSGIYSINPDGQGGLSSFNVYCDMTTDDGGWTLILAGGNFQFGKSNAFWDGTGSTSQGFSYDSETLNTADSEKIIRAMPFEEMRFFVGGTGGIFRSDTLSTFAQKKSSVTPWTKVSGALDNLEWNVNDVDGYSRGEFLLGFRGPLFAYGDYYWFYLGGNVHGVGNFYGHRFQWVGDSDSCGNSEGCTEATHIRYHGIGYSLHRFSYSYSTDQLWFR